MKKITVNDLGEIITGHTPPTGKREFYGDAYPFLKPTDMVIGLKYTYEIEEGYSEIAAQKYKNSLIPRYSTCVVCIGTLGEKMCMAHCDLFTNQSVNSIIPNEKFDPHYVYYLLKYNLHRVKALNKGTASGREFVSKSTFLDLELDVYEDKATQKKVAGILSTFDNLIENNQKQIKLLEEAALRLYKEWFVDLRFPGYESVEIVDGIPEGWENCELNDFCYVTDGTHDSPKTKDYGIPLVTGKCIKNGYIDYSDANLISVEDHSKIIKRSGLKTGDILFSNIGTIGSTCRVDYDREFSVKNVIILKPDTVAQTNFLYCWINSRYIQDTFLNQTNGSSQQFIGLSFMRKFGIIVPTNELIDKFNNLVSVLLTRKDLLHRQTEQLGEMRDRLLPKLMSGEIEV